MDRVKQILVEKEREATLEIMRKPSNETAFQTKFNRAAIQPEYASSSENRVIGREVVDVESPRMFQPQQQQMISYEDTSCPPIRTERKPKNALHGLFEV